MGKKWFPLLFLIAAICSASAVTINNPGFETDIVGSGSFNSAITPASWSTYDPTNVLNRNYSDVGVLNPTPPLYTAAPEGSNVALIFLWPQNAGDYNQPVGLQQLLTSSLQPNTQYTLTVQVGNIGDAGPVPYELSGFPGYAVQLLAGPNLNSLTLLSQDNNTLSIPEATFSLSTVTYTTGSSVTPGQFLAIRLLNLNLGNPNSGIEVNYDDVKLDASAVPEPSSAALLVGSLLVASAINRKRTGRA